MDPNDITIAHAIKDDMTFRLHVAEALGSLKTDIKSIVGNGQPGRLGVLESRIPRLEKFMWTLAGGLGLAALAIGWLVTLLKG